MLIWNTLFALFMTTFFVCILLLTVCRFTKNRYFNDFVEDELIQEKIDGSARNYIYTSSLGARKYIKKYVLRKSGLDTSLVCNYADSFEHISYFIKVFNKKKRVIQVIRCDESDVGSSSHIIIVNHKCEYVNIVIRSVNDRLLNDSVICPVPAKSIWLYSLLTSLAVFSTLYISDFLLMKIIAGNKANLCFQNQYNLLLLGVGILLTFFYFLMVKRRLFKKNYRAKTGGYLDYEFV